MPTPPQFMRPGSGPTSKSYQSYGFLSYYNWVVRTCPNYSTWTQKRLSTDILSQEIPKWNTKLLSPPMGKIYTQRCCYSWFLQIENQLCMTFSRSLWTLDVKTIWTKKHRKKLWRLGTSPCQDHRAVYYSPGRMGRCMELSLSSVEDGEGQSNMNHSFSLLFTVPWQVHAQICKQICCNNLSWHFNLTFNQQQKKLFYFSYFSPLHFLFRFISFNLITIVFIQFILFELFH